LASAGDPLRFLPCARAVGPSLYYFRQHLFFETAAEKYEWINGTMAFGIVISKFKGGPGVIYDAYIVE
jgi:hypothetical protein